MQENCIERSKLLHKLGNFVRVRPIESPRSGEAVRNQYEIVFERGRAFQSYNTLIGVYWEGNLYLAPEHDCSVTTSKWCGEWCGYNAKERRKRIKEGKILQMA